MDTQTNNPNCRKEPPAVLRRQTNWQNLNFYRRSVILYQLTVAFCQRFLPLHGDRTVDQMVQAARSTKQNIIEGFTDGQTSVKSELYLLGIARGSCQELLADYHDYLTSHGLVEWRGTNPRFEALLRFCRTHVELADYQPHFSQWSDDEMANCAICLAHLIDKGLDSIIKRSSADFTQHGGLKERMYAARNACRGGAWEQALFSWLTSADSPADLQTRALQVRQKVERLVRETRRRRGWQASEPQLS